MSEPVRQLLELFDALPDPDKGSVFREILLRMPSGEPDMQPSELDSLADELFLMLDIEEETRASKG